MSMLQKFISNSRVQNQEDRDAELYRALIRREAKIGGEIFGAVPAGTKREFFCLDEHTWIWHEEWVDANKKRQVKTTRYDVNPSSILKAQDGQSYQQVSMQEAERLAQAIKVYSQRVHTELYAPYL